MKPSKNNKTKLAVSNFLRSKKTIAVSLAIASISATNVSMAINSDQFDLVQEPVVSISQVSQKFRAASSNRAIKGQYIVVLKDQSVASQATTISGMSTLSAVNSMSFRKQVVQNMAADMSAMHNGRVTKRFHAALSGFVVKMNHKDMQKMLADDRIEFIEQDQLMSASATQSNPTWGLDRIDQANLPLDSSYTYNDDGTGVTAYIVDTGILTSHSNFGGRASGGFTAINDGNGTSDCNGHGTHVAGTVGSSTYGVAKNVNLVPVRVLGCDGTGSNSGVIDGVEWVAQNAVKPAVANMSLGGGNSTALDNAVNNAMAQGVLFVVAAGNDNSDACSGSPNRVPNALTVASSDQNDARSIWTGGQASSWGSCIDLFAPGTDIKSTWSNGGTNTISGTSMAAPHVAGAAALYLDANPNATYSQVSSHILSNAVSGKISDLRGSPNLLLQTGADGGPVEPPVGGVLQNGVAKTGLGASSGNDLTYTMEVPSGATNIKFDMSGGSGDADLYVKFGSAPTDSSYDCRPYKNGNSESCTGSQSGGTYHVRVKAYSTFSGVSLTGSYTDPGTGGVDPINVSQSNISVSSGQWSRYTYNLPSGYSTMTVSISGGSGDADLYVRHGAQSTTSAYDCRPYKNGNNETCTFSSPAAGTWYLDIRGYSAASGVTLNLQAN